MSLTLPRHQLMSLGLAGFIAVASVAAIALFLNGRRRRKGPPNLSASASAPGPATGGPCTLTPEVVAQFPGRSTVGRRGAPVRITWTPDDKGLVYLQTGQSGAGTDVTQRLFLRTLTEEPEAAEAATDGGAGSVVELFTADHLQEGDLSKEEKARRERQRIMSTGVTTYQRAPAAPHRMLIPSGNELFMSVSLDGSSGSGKGKGAPPGGSGGPGGGGSPMCFQRIFDGSELPGWTLSPLTPVLDAAT